MALDKYYFNISTKQWARSFDDPGQVAAPIFANTDVRDFGVTFLRSIGGSDVEVLPATLGVRVDIADPAAPGAPLTGVSGTADDNNEYSFLLPITGFTTFLSGVTQPKLARIEFTFTSAGIPKNRYHSSVFITPNTSADVSADPPEGDRALGAGEAEGIYLPRQVPQGTFLLWPDEDTGLLYTVRLKGGQLRADIQ